MNFVAEFAKGKLGKNKGLPMGIPALTKDTLGIQKEHIYVIAAPPKVGKTTLVDFIFLLAVYMLSTAEQLSKVRWIYYSFEISRIQKEFKLAAFFMFRDFKVQNFVYKNVTYKISGDYLMGKLLDQDELSIPVTTEHEEMLKIIYKTRIIPLFGEYNIRGERIKEGKIDFIEEKDNPTGINKYLLSHARKHGKFQTRKYTITNELGNREQKEEIIGYTSDDPDEHLIIITDHVRKLRRERNFSMKENVDKYAEYQVELRNRCRYTFVDVVHTNRGLFELDRIKYAGEWFYPTSEDIKDTGNLSEDANAIFTMFDANDDKFGIKRHFELDLQDKNNKLLHPNYRSLHLVESRHIEGVPLHYQLDMFGNLNWFQSIKK